MDLLTVLARADGLTGSDFLIVTLFSIVVVFTLPTIAIQRIRHTLPTKDDIERGQQYYSQINDRFGAVIGKDRLLSWKANSSLHLLKKSAFVVTNSDERELLRVEKRRRFSLSFEMLESGQHVGTIRLRSSLLNKYTLTLNDGATWTFLLPLYTVHFRGDSTTGERVWMQVGPRTKLQWMVLVKPEFEDLRILCAIAFIHRRWYL